MALYLKENLTFDAARMEVINESTADGKGKNLYMKGIFIQGGVKNHNERVYPVNEIEKAVSTLNEQIKGGYSVLGEVDHPDDLKINLDRVSTMLESGVKLGVSSRGSGNVNEADGKVSDFEIVTVDVVAQPSAPNAYPTAIYEGLMNMKGGSKVFEMAREASADQKVQKYLKQAVTSLIKDLKIK